MFNSLDLDRLLKGLVRLAILLPLPGLLAGLLLGWLIFR
jgi:hypothetical protein